MGSRSPRGTGRGRAWLIGLACLGGTGFLGCGNERNRTDAGGSPDAGPRDAAVPEVCIGVRPPASAWSAEPGPVRFLPDGGPLDAGAETDGGGVADAGPEADAGAQSDGGPEEPCAPIPATCIGAPTPEWALTDFQPQSCGYGATYGLDVFRGHTTVVALLAAW